MELMTYLLLMIFKCSASNALVITTEQSKNWFEANNECVNKGGRLAHPKELHPSTCANKSINVWIGKYNQERLTPWIAKKGCYNRGKKPIHSIASVLECYRSCKSTSFGFKKPNWCSCTEDTPVIPASYSACLTTNNYLWLYDSTYIDLSDDENTMDCLTAQCTENGTILRPANCRSPKIAHCQNQNYTFNTAEKKTQANSEGICNDKTDYLISKQICSSLHVDPKNTPEFWTGMQRYHYNETESLTGNERQEVNSTDIFHCVYVKCPIKSGLVPVEYIENCKGHLDGFACNLNETSDNITTVKSSSGRILPSTLISSSESSSMHFGSVSMNTMNVQPKSTVVISLWSDSSISTHGQSSIRSSIVPTRVTSDLMFAHASKLGASASINTSPKSTINSNTDMSSRVYSSDGTELNESKNINRTSNRNISSRHQFSTGLIVGISVSILCLVVLIIGAFGIYRLRNQRAFKDKSLDFPTPINTMKIPNYHDIDNDPKKETNVIENDSTHPVVSVNDDHMPFRLADNTPNSKKIKPNDAYAVVVKKPVTTKVDNTSNSKSTKSNKAQDEYAVVVKIPGENQDKDENTSLDIPESNYDSMNQPRPISGNESCNIYDTSIGHRDDTDPTHNTTTHIQARDKTYESDYDHL